MYPRDISEYRIQYIATGSNGQSSIGGTSYVVVEV
jgi:hypothetical protein